MALLGRSRELREIIQDIGSPEHSTEITFIGVESVRARAVVMGVTIANMTREHDYTVGT